MSASSHLYKASALMLASAILSLQSAAAAEALQTGKILHYANQFPPSVCAVLSGRPLPGAENYVQVIKDGKVIDSPVSLGESEICVNNLAHGQHYLLKLQKGLPAVDGAVLASDQSIEISIPDAKEELTFKPGTLLPRADQSFLEIDSVNLKQVKLYLFRLSLNDLSAVNLNQLLSYQLDNGTLTDLLERHASLMSSRLIDLKSAANQKLTTRLDLSEALKDSQGLILALATDPSLDLGMENNESSGSAMGSIYNLYDTQKAFAAKLVNISNYTISSFKGSSLLIQVHNLKTAEPVGGADVTLLARNNSKLGSFKTDKAGFVYFAPELLQGKRADRPAAVMVEKKGDMALLSLDSPEIFLPEEGVNQPLKTQVQVFATAGRGIFRPGEELNLSAFIRDAEGNASSAPVSLIVQGPNGVELYRTLLKDNELGTYFVDYKLSDAAARGSYSIIFKQGETELQRLTFDVADFVPATLKLSADAAEGSLQSGGSCVIALKANFNYGDPAANLDSSAYASLEPDPEPLTQYTGYHFGPAVPWELQQSLPLEGVKTDNNGEARFTLNIPKLTYAAKLTFTGEVYDLNREQTVTVKEFKFSPETALIGLKDDANKDEIALVYTGSDGKEQAGRLDYTVYKLSTNFQYIFEYGRWNYRRQSIKHPVDSGSLEVNGTASLPLALDDGQYMIEVKDNKGAVSSLNFTQGYMTDAGIESPERIELALNKESYKPGESVKVSFDSPFDGWATLLVTKDEVKETRTVDVKKGHNQLSFAFRDYFAPGVKVLVSLYAPLKDNPAGAVRALGQISVSADNSGRRIALNVDAPKQVKPGDKITVKVKSDSKEDFYLQPYLVDSGILSLTGFKAPDPFAAVFGPRASAITLQDSYRFLLRSTDPYSQGYGADENFKAFAQALSALSTIPREIYAQALPPVLVKDGSAELNFTAPKLSGELTLMLTAASKEGLGSAAQPITLKDDLNVSLALPRYLRKGDEAQAALAVHNVGPAASFKVKLNCSDGLDCEINNKVVTLDEGQSRNVSFKLTADALGTGSVSFEIDGIKGSEFSYADRASMQVLPAWSKALYTQVQKLEPGASAEVDFGGVQFTKLDAASTSMSLLPLVNSELFLKRLSDLPAWSTLVTASKALSFVEAKQAKLLGASDEKIPVESVQLLADELLTRQQGDGSFNLYGYTMDYYTTALSALTLSSLKAAGYAVPEDALKRALTAAERAARYGSDSARALAYLTLMQYSQASMSDLYYFSTSKDLKSVEAMAILARCFELSGDASKAAELAAAGVKAFKEMAEVSVKLYALPYTGQNKDERNRLTWRMSELASSSAAGLLHDGFLLLTLPLSAEDNSAVVNTLLSLKSSSDCYRATDLAAMICAQGRLYTGTEGATTAPLSAHAVPHEGMPPYEIKNDSAAALYATSSAYGLTAAAPAAVSDGISICKDYFTLEGEPVALPAALKANEQLIVRLKTKLTAPASGNLVVRDALPTGFKGSEASGLDAKVHGKLCGQIWSYPESSQISESEYLSILNTYQNEQCLLYLQQPSFNGSFALPAAEVQLLNNGAVRGSTAVQSAAFSIGSK